MGCLVLFGLRHVQEAFHVPPVHASQPLCPLSFLSPTEVCTVTSTHHGLTPEQRQLREMLLLARVPAQSSGSSLPRTQVSRELKSPCRPACCCSELSPPPLLATSADPVTSAASQHPARCARRGLRAPAAQLYGSSGSNSAIMAALLRWSLLALAVGAAAGDSVARTSRAHRATGGQQCLETGTMASQCGRAAALLLRCTHLQPPARTTSTWPAPTRCPLALSSPASSLQRQRWERLRAQHSARACPHHFTAPYVARTTFSARVLGVSSAQCSAGACAAAGQA